MSALGLGGFFLSTLWGGNSKTKATRPFDQTAIHSPPGPAKRHRTLLAGLEHLDATDVYGL